MADASACMTLGKLYMSNLGKPTLPERKWGQETANLPPTSSDCMKMEHPLDDQSIALACLNPIFKGHKSLALKPQKDSITGPTGATGRTLNILSKELSVAVYKSLKSQGKTGEFSASWNALLEPQNLSDSSFLFSVSHGVDCARQVACWSLGTAAARKEGKELEEGYIVSFEMLLNRLRSSLDITFYSNRSLLFLPCR